MATKFPPKGYNQMEYPLPHQFDYNFGLSAEIATKNATMVTLIKSYEAMNAADAIEVNPSHSAFLEETGPVCQVDSIIPRLNISMSAMMTQTSAGGALDDIKVLKFHWMPIYMSFIDTYEAMENETNAEVEDVIEMQHTVAQKDGNPLWSNTDLLESATTGYLAHPVNTVNITGTFTTTDLTTDLKMESIAFDPDHMFDILSYGSNSSMLRKVMGQYHTEYITQDRTWVRNSNNFTHPSVKRMNEYTFCGVIFYLPLVDSSQQFGNGTDITETKNQIDFKIRVRYDEWNSQFDQTST